MTVSAEQQQHGGNDGFSPWTKRRVQMYEAEDKHPGPTDDNHGPSRDRHGPPRHLNRSGVKKEKGEDHSKEVTEAANR